MVLFWRLVWVWVCFVDEYSALLNSGSASNVSPDAAGFSDDYTDIGVRGSGRCLGCLIY